MEVLAFQVFILATIIFTYFVKKDWLIGVCIAWTVETLLFVFTTPLAVLQLGVIWGCWFYLTGGRGMNAMGNEENNNGVEHDIEGDQELFNILREWRLNESRERGVPAFIVLHDDVLHQIASIRCVTLECLADVRGIGPVKLHDYGQDIIDLVSEFQERNGDTNAGGEPQANNLDEEVEEFVGVFQQEERAVEALDQDVFVSISNAMRDAEGFHRPDQFLDCVDDEVIEDLENLTVNDDDHENLRAEFLEMYNLFRDYSDLREDIGEGILSVQHRDRFLNELLYIHNQFPGQYAIREVIDTNIRELNEMNNLVDEHEAIANAVLNHTINILQEQTHYECGSCGAPMLIREGANGFFWGCSTFPDCWSTRPLTPSENNALQGNLD